MATNDAVIRLMERVRTDIKLLREGRREDAGIVLIDRLYADSKVLSRHLGQQKRQITSPDYLEYIFDPATITTHLIDTRTGRRHHEP